MSHVIICNIIIFYTEGDCLISKFDEVYEIMKESFPVDEFREYKEQKKLLSRPNYFLKTTLHHDEVTAFCVYYEFDDFIYIEHLACTEKVRGQGIGTQLIRDVRGKTTTDYFRGRTSNRYPNEKKSRILQEIRIHLK